MAITIGQQAPRFTLKNTEKQEVNLTDFSNKNVLLLFFPLAFTSTCTAELCSVRDNLKLYESLDVQPIGISVDSMHTLAKYKEEQNLNFPLLSDWNKDVSKAYEAFYEDFHGMHGVSKRAAFLIDKQGMVQYAEVLENAREQPNFAAIQVKLRELTE